MTDVTSSGARGPWESAEKRKATASYKLLGLAWVRVVYDLIS